MSLTTLFISLSVIFFVNFIVFLILYLGKDTSYSCATTSCATCARHDGYSNQNVAFKADTQTLSVSIGVLIFDTGLTFVMTDNSNDPIIAVINSQWANAEATPNLVYVAQGETIKFNIFLNASDTTFIKIQQIDITGSEILSIQILPQVIDAMALPSSTLTE